MSREHLDFIAHPEAILRERDKTIDSYLDSLSVKDDYEAYYVADKLGGKPIHDTVVIIPVAAHSESRNVYRALGEYARQRDCDPFTVHLHLNYPISLTDMSGVNRTVDELRRAKQDFPGLDLRLSGTEYADTTIGHIRRVAWNGTLMKLRGQQDSSAQAIGINHDIDLMKLSSRYIARVQAFYRRRDQAEILPAYLPTATTETKHFPSPDHPNTSRAAYWADFTIRMLDAGYEAGVVVPFATYAMRGGFRSSSLTHETADLLDRGTRQSPLIRGTSLQTSIRRLVARLPVQTMKTVWTADSFGMDDSCRIRELTDFEDMSEVRLHRQISENIPVFSSGYLTRYLGWYLTRKQIIALKGDDDDAREAATLQIVEQTSRVGRMASYVLENLLDMPGYGMLVQDSYLGEKAVRRSIVGKRLQLQNQDRLVLTAETRREAHRVEMMAKIMQSDDHQTE